MCFGSNASSLFDLSKLSDSGGDWFRLCTILVFASTFVVSTDMYKNRDGTLIGFLLLAINSESLDFGFCKLNEFVLVRIFLLVLVRYAFLHSEAQTETWDFGEPFHETFSSLKTVYVI